MSIARWLWQSLVFYRRGSLSLLCGTALAAAILTGALAVGDSVRFTLQTQATLRLGHVRYAIDRPGRFFDADLAERLAARLQAPVAAALTTAAAVSQPDSGREAHQVRVYGVDDAFWNLTPEANIGLPALDALPESVYLNAELARSLQVEVGQAVVLRLDKPGSMSRDAPLSTAADDSIAARVTVAGILSDRQGGRFSLQADSTAARNAFVPRRWLQEKLAQPAKADLLLFGDGATQAIDDREIAAALRSVYRLADLELALRPLGESGGLELTTRHVFLDADTVAAARALTPAPQEILTYFVNALEVGDRSTPYSLVAAVDPAAAAANGARATALPIDLRDDEIAINAWLAADLNTRPGDAMTVHYFVMGPLRQLVEKQARFTVRAVLPMTDRWCDRGLMPDYPGIADSENCRDWEPGIPIDVQRIRDQDESYWDEYRGTPKAFITLKAGSALWDNRFGNRTALRFARPAQEPSAVAVELQARLDPAQTGLQARAVAQSAAAASRNGTDFGGLFFGLSFFLLIAALILLALLYSFGLQGRTEEIGVLLALGLLRRQIRRMFLMEAALTAMAGSAVGAGLGVLYTQALVAGLSGGWRGAVNATPVLLHVEPATLGIGFAAAVAMSLAVVGWVLRGRFGYSPRALLNQSGELPLTAADTGRGHRRAWFSGSLAVLCLTAAAGWSLWGWAQAGDRAAAFFGIGALVLVGCLAWNSASLWRRAAGMEGAAVANLRQLAWRGAGVRRGRSLAVVALIAGGCFLVAAVSGGRAAPTVGVELRSGGAGGFGLYLETTLPLFFDLNSAAGQEAYGLDPASLAETAIVPLRVLPGDDASCLNLNRAQAPRLLGVQPEAFDRRAAFSFLHRLPEVDAAHPWLALSTPIADGTVAAIGDEATVYWALGKNVGEIVEMPDGRGGVLRLKIVAMLRNSVLQGSLVIAENAWARHFPNASGYNLFLIDVAPDAADRLAGDLARGLRNYGPEIATGGERLRRFHAVEETYLAIFGLLGGLALLLGSLGMGLVLVRNALERRSELAILRAVGLSTASVQRLLWLEYGGLLIVGWSIGVAAALAALVPTLAVHFETAPIGELGGLLVLLLACGFGSIGLAARWAACGPLLAALRKE